MTAVPHAITTLGQLSPDELAEELEQYWTLLTETPTMSDDQLLEYGIDAAATADLVYLEDIDGDAWYPDFQFDLEQCIVVPAVLGVNAVFCVDEEDDHYAVWQWWVCAHPSLGGESPVSQLGILPDEQLVQLAQATCGEL